MVVRWHLSFLSKKLETKALFLKQVHCYSNFDEGLRRREVEIVASNLVNTVLLCLQNHYEFYSCSFS